jgi:hypothetical protein
MNERLAVCSKWNFREQSQREPPCTTAGCFCFLSQTIPPDLTETRFKRIQPKPPFSKLEGETWHSKMCSLCVSLPKTHQIHI